MNRLLERYGFVRNAEGGGGAGGGGEGGSPPSPESVLFPNEGGENKEGEGDPPTDPPAGNADDKAGDWKEYVPDPNKSDEENAAAKAEHDKTKPADKKDDPADKVPDDGKYTLTMPEGVQVDQELLDALGSDFKDLGLTNGQAQKLADKFIAVQQERMTKTAEGWANTVSGWVDTAKADAEIGGTKWDGTVKDAQKAVKAFGTPALKEYLEASGGGNHPEVIRLMAKVGKLIKEDVPADGGAGGTGKPVEAAHVLFPNDAPKGG